MYTLVYTLTKHKNLKTKYDRALKAETVCALCKYNTCSFYKTLRLIKCVTMCMMEKKLNDAQPSFIIENI